MARVSEIDGNYILGAVSEGNFTPEQLRFLADELRKISGALSNLDQGYRELEARITAIETFLGI